jgi:hypothetical protein
MFEFILGYLVLSLVSIAILVVIAKNAPLGYEDENGFSLGRPEDKD